MLLETFPNKGKVINIINNSNNNNDNENNKDSKSNNSNTNNNDNGKSFKYDNSDKGYEWSYVLIIQAFLEPAFYN